MTPARRVAFEGHDCVRLEGAGSTVYVTVSTGPRVLGLVVEERNLLAVLPDATLDAPGGERYRLLGGHRLWAAPEAPEVTYRPDDRPCSVDELDGGGVAVEAPPDGAGLAKSISVRPDGDDGGWVVEHVLRNASDRAMRVAPWAITMLAPGGEAVLPLGRSPAGLQADRAIVLWPYTDPADRRITFGRDEVRLDGSGRGPATKVGAAPGTGRVAYRLGEVAFEKHTQIDPVAEYADRGAATQVYLCDEFCELESLGALRDLAPGEAATHRERWIVRRVADGAGGGGA